MASRVLPWPAMLIGALALASTNAHGQDPAPAGEPRIDNTYGGFDHQPSEADVDRLEQQDGVAPSVAEDRRDDAEVDKLYRELEPPSSPRSAPPPP